MSRSREPRERPSDEVPDGAGPARPADTPGPLPPDSPPAAQTERSDGIESANELDATSGLDEAPGLGTADQFWTIEVADRSTGIDGPHDPLAAGYSARRWKESRGEALIEAALTHGAKEWNWALPRWGVVLEVSFADEADWLRFRGTAAVRAALDAVPDPVNGIYIYPGRGGTSGATAPTRPRPRPQSGGAVPEDPELDIRDRPLGQHLTHPTATSAREWRELATPGGRP
jgi:hypothetical protein